MFERKANLPPRSDSRQDGSSAGGIVAAVKRWRSGDTVVLRELWDGRVWQARPAIVVRDDDRMFVDYVPARMRYRRPVAADGTPLRIPTQHWTLEEIEWDHQRVLAFSFPETWYAVILYWDDTTDEFQGYYMNIQSPLRRTPIGFDTVECLLDAVVPPDRSSWAWKDEDELRESVARGMFTEEDAAAFYAAGERGVEHVLLREPPFDEPWEEWRPDPDWPLPELPPGWDVI